MGSDFFFRRFVYMLALLLTMFVSVSAQDTKAKFPYLNPKLSTEERVNDLLGRMTIAEKIAQLQSEIQEVDGRDSIITKGLGNLAVTLRPLGPREAAEKANRIQKLAVEKTRWGIPIIIHDEALHGLIGKEATSFPQAIGLAATWNPALMEQIASVIGKQTRSRGIRQVLSPTINIARDVRWGRTEETYGEDPHLTTRMAVAFCKGVEAEGVISTPKHFAANVGDGGRDSHAIHFSERLLREIYFPAFKACIQEARATSVMAAYNSLEGVPCSANRWLLTDILRKEWDFTGFVVSDYGSVGGMMSLHHTAANTKEAAEQALEAGLEVELPGIYCFGQPLLQAVKEGAIAHATIDTAVARILRAKFRLGLFENPYVDPAEAAKNNDTPEHRALALHAAREAIVLLKNENNFLPLKKDLKSIAVIGSNADANRLGGYSGFGMKIVTVLEGIKNKVSPATKVSYAKGCDLGETALPPIPAENLFPPNAKKGEQGLRGEYFSNMNLAGQPTLVRLDKQINFDWGGGPPDSSMAPDRFSVRWTGTLIPAVTNIYKMSITTDDGVRLFIDGKLIVDSWVDRAPTTDYFTMKLEANRHYDLRIEYYENGGGAFASLGWNLETGVDKEMVDAIAIAKNAEAAIIVAGIIEGEGRDRADLNLPGSQEELIKAVTATGVPTAVVLMTGSAVTMRNWIDEASAIIEAWYAGEEGGNAIADVLFGDYNPGGKLPLTFPQSVGQVPLYYNVKPSGRGYDYVSLSGKPQFPFGHGLSYTQFEYTNLQISPKQISPTQTVQISVDVKNTGTRAGEEVVQMYLRDVVASVARPLKELKSFKRITLKSREKQTVTFALMPEQLSFLDQNMKTVVEPGEFEVMVGSSSEDIRLRGSFEIR